MECECFQAHVGAFVDGELEASVTLECERHLERCPSCRELLLFEDTYRGLVKECTNDALKAPDSLAERVRAAIDLNNQCACAPFRGQLGLLIDGEIEPRDFLELEEHLQGCSHCAEHLEFEQAYRKIVREACAMPAAPDSLHTAVRARLTEASAPLATVIPLKERMVATGSIAVAAAAAVLMGVAISPADRTETALEDIARLQASAPTPAAAVPNQPNQPIEARPVSMGVEPAQVSQWLRDRGSLPVQPAEFEGSDVRLIGAKLGQVQERDAAALYYDVHGRLMTVVITDANLPNAAQVDGRPVRTRRAGRFTYTFTGDLDPHTLDDLARRARVQLQASP